MICWCFSSGVNLSLFSLTYFHICCYIWSVLFSALLKLTCTVNCSLSGVCLLLDHLHLFFTAHRPCASQTTASGTQSATPAQIAALTWGWEVTFGWEMWCTVRSTPNRGTKAQVVPPKPLCPLAIESAVPYLSHSGCRGLLVFLKAHFIWLRYRPWDGAWSWTLVNDMAEDVLYSDHI